MQFGPETAWVNGQCVEKCVWKYRRGNQNSSPTDAATPPRTCVGV